MINDNVIDNALTSGCTSPEQRASEFFDVIKSAYWAIPEDKYIDDWFDSLPLSYQILGLETIRLRKFIGNYLQLVELSESHMFVQKKIIEHKESGLIR